MDVSLKSPLGDGDDNGMSGLIDLRGKNAVITGGSRGVGRATALLMAQAGASVGIGYRSREAEARETVEEVRALGVHAWAQAGDLGSAEGADDLFSRADEEFDGLDVFVGNAGIWPPVDIPVEEVNSEHPYTLDLRWRDGC